MAPSLLDRYTFVVSPQDEDGEFIALCPAFPGLSAFGETPEAALSEARTALAGFIEVYQDKGWRLPQPDRVPSESDPVPLLLSKDLYARLARLASAKGVALSEMLAANLADALGDD